MRLSEYIARLEALLAAHGDLPVHGAATYDTLYEETGAPCMEVVEAGEEATINEGDVSGIYDFRRLLIAAVMDTQKQGT